MTDENDAGPEDWDWNDAPDDDTDDTPTGTDTDFSGDTATSPPVGAATDNAESDELFDRLAEDVAENDELAAFLAGNRKAVLVHKSHQYSNRLHEVVGYARLQAKGRCSLGLVVPFRQPPANVRAFMRAFPSTAIRFADPEVHLHREYYNEVSATAVKHWAYFCDGLPTAPDRDWTLALLAHQVRAGATVLLTPTGRVEEANAEVALDEVRDWVALSRSLVGDAPLFANLTMNHCWLSERSIRDRLLAEIVDSTEQHWYLRFRWPIVDPSYGQLNARAILDGYAELTAVCAEEDKILVLPNSDLTGWVMTALGAAAFGTATSITDRYFADRRIVRGRKDQPRPDPKKRYFSRDLLHTIEQPTHHSLLSEPGYSRCRCQFCMTTLRPDRPAPADWDLAAVGYHYVQKAVMLTAAVADDPHPRAHARRRVRDAITFADGLPPTKELTGDDRPQHLDTWRSLLL